MFFIGIVFSESLLILFLSFAYLYLLSSEKSDPFFWFFFLFGLHGLYYVFLFGGMMLQYPTLYGIGILFPFLHNPMLYFLLRKLTGGRGNLHLRDLVHYIPFLLLVIYLLPFFFASDQVKLHLVEDVLQSVDPFSLPGYLPGWVLISYMVYSIILYFTLIWGRFNLIHSGIKNSYQQHLGKLYYGWFLLLATGFAGTVISNRMDESQLFSFNLSLVGFSSVFFMISYILVLKSKAGFQSEGERLIKTGGVQKNRGKSFNAGKFEEDRRMLNLKNRLEELMGAEKLFLDDQLSLHKLATRLDISSHELSRLINSAFGLRFQDYINRFRVDEAMVKLKCCPQCRQVEVAFEVGFGSFSSFQTAFKKVTGLTPGAWRDRERDLS